MPIQGWFAIHGEVRCREKEKKTRSLQTDHKFETYKRYVQQEGKYKKYGRRKKIQHYSTMLHPNTGREKVCRKCERL